MALQGPIFIDFGATQSDIEKTCFFEFAKITKIVESIDHDLAMVAKVIKNDNFWSPFGDPFGIVFSIFFEIGKSVKQVARAHGLSHKRLSDT